MLNGDSSVEECDKKEACDFLSLLKKRNNKNNETSLGEMAELEWERVVNKSSRESTSFAFSKKSCSVHECALERTKMTNMLVIFTTHQLKKVVTQSDG